MLATTVFVIDSSMLDREKSKIFARAFGARNIYLFFSVNRDYAKKCLNRFMVTLVAVLG